MAEEKNLENKIKKFLKSEECLYLKYWAGGGFTNSGTFHQHIVGRRSLMRQGGRIHDD